MPGLWGTEPVVREEVRKMVMMIMIVKHSSLISGLGLERYWLNGSMGHGTAEVDFSSSSR